jgi:hypothetical protein
MTAVNRAERFEQRPSDGFVVDNMIDSGAHVFPEPVDARAAGALLRTVKTDRAFDHGLFLTESQFDADPQFRGVNPRRGRNFLERADCSLEFVETSPQIVAALTSLLGEGYEILDRKLVCGVPAKSIPGWLKARIEGRPVNNLGAYVKPIYRDITYFYGIDFHQDLIDYKDREADFLTLYVYLHPVTEADAPLHLLERSHILGATVFPHAIERAGPDRWLYSDGCAGKMMVGQRVLTGPTGLAALWHSCTLHGTQPDAADHERISLRYLFMRKAGVSAGIDLVNAAVKGPLRLKDTRNDLAENGSTNVIRNLICGSI